MINTTLKELFILHTKLYLVLGKAVEVITPTGPIPATALSIDEHFRLVVRYSDGREAALSQGEVSVRPGKE